MWLPGPDPAKGSTRVAWELPAAVASAPLEGIVACMPGFVTDAPPLFGGMVVFTIVAFNIVASAGGNAGLGEAAPGAMVASATVADGVALAILEATGRTDGSSETVSANLSAHLGHLGLYEPAFTSLMLIECPQCGQDSATANHPSAITRQITSAYRLLATCGPPPIRGTFPKCSACCLPLQTFP